MQCAYSPAGWKVPGIMAGTTLDDIQDIRQKIEWGYRFINVGSPMGYGMRALQQNLDTLRSG